MGLPVLGLIALAVPTGPLAVIVPAVAMSVVAIVYLLGFWARNGQTPGMMSVGLRVMNAEGAPPSLGQALGRLLLGMFPVPGFSLLFAHPVLGGSPLQDRLTHTTIDRV